VFKIWMSTNHKPVVPDDSDAMWERLKPIPFTVQFIGAKADPNIEGKLKAEANGVFNWMLIGLKDYLVNGLVEPASVTSSNQEYRTGEDRIVRFLDDETTPAMKPSEQVQAKEIYARYQSWAKQSNEYVMSVQKFCAELDSHGVKSSKPDNKKMYRLKLNQSPSWFSSSAYGADQVMGDVDDDKPTVM